jgi:hypothetical protein
MRKHILMGTTILRLAAIGITLTMLAMAEPAQFDRADAGRAHSTLVACRAQSISV